ncbi:MAG: response regulator transcription factor [Bacteroidota bacterium]
MEKLKVLLAEDDKNLGLVLQSYLNAKGYSIRLTTNGIEAFETFKKDTFDFCIFDVMMPLKDGFTLAKEVRAINKKMPILFLTAKTMQEDILQGFKAGGDDYLTKPFSMEELLARMQAILRRSGVSLEVGPQAKLFRLGKFTFDYHRQVLSADTGEQKLTSKEAELLKLLCENNNQVLDRKDALNKIWHDDSYFNARSMDVYIVKLRKLLKDDAEVELINVHGVGFKLITKN